MQIPLKALIFIVLFLMIFSFLIFYMSIRPQKIITNLKPSDLGLKYEEEIDFIPMGSDQPPFNRFWDPRPISIAYFQYPRGICRRQQRGWLPG